MATQIVPSVAARRDSADGLIPQGLKPTGHVQWNLVAP